MNLRVSLHLLSGDSHENLRGLPENSCLSFFGTSVLSPDRVAPGKVFPVPKSNVSPAATFRYGLRCHRLYRHDRVTPGITQKGSSMILENNSKLVMIGDSITDCGRAQPVGEGREDALGRGYVSLVDALLGSALPNPNIRIVNMGTSGNTVRDLQARWQRDVLDLKPDWVSVMIGINDVWRQFDSPRQTEIHIHPGEYATALDDLIARTQPQVRGMILLTPFYIEPNQSDPMRAMMDRYGAIVQDLARKHGTVFVDTQAAFDAVLETIYPATLAWDRVHPNPTGHMVLARAFLNALGFTW